MDEPGIFYVLERRAVVTGDQLVDSAAELRPERPAGGELPLQPGRRRGLRRLHRREHRQPVRDRARRAGDLGAGDPVAHLRAARGSSPAASPPRNRRSSRSCSGPGRCRPRSPCSSSAPSGRSSAPTRSRAGETAAIVAFVGIIVFMVATYGLLRRDRLGRHGDEHRAADGADDAARGDADHARHRRPRALDRHGGRRQRADLRAHPRGAEDRARPGARDRARLREGAARRSSTAT